MTAEEIAAKLLPHERRLLLEICAAEGPHTFRASSATSHTERRDENNRAFVAMDGLLLLGARTRDIWGRKAVLALPLPLGRSVAALLRAMEGAQ